VDTIRELPPSLRKYFGDPAAPPIEHWSDERLRDYQTYAVAEQLAHVYANSRFYRAKFDQAGVRPGDFQCLEDLVRFPFTSKDELCAGGSNGTRGDPWLLLAVTRDEVCLAHTSTGTTGGNWSYLFYTWEDMHVRDFAPCPRLLMPVHASDVVLNALPYEMSSSGQSFQRCLQGVAGALVVPAGKGGFYSDPYKTMRIMADLRATVLITTPPYAMLLAEVAEQLGYLPGSDLSPRFMWLTGEGCASSYRRRLEELWHCQALVFYGSMECGSIGIECPRQAGGHVSMGHLVLEVIDPVTNRPAAPGQTGEVVCTVLQRRASPLVRFRTQDLAVLDPTPCPCGVRFPRLQVRGRIADQVNRTGAATAEPSVSPYIIEEVLYAQPEMGNNYQVYTGGPRLRIDGELRQSAREPNAARARIVETLRQRGVDAELIWVEHVPRQPGKTRRVRPLAERDGLMKAVSLLRRGSEGAG
jgi:phenylacetate-CoA ligase